MKKFIASEEIFHGVWKLKNWTQEFKGTKYNKSLHPFGEVGKDLDAIIIYLKGKMMFCYVQKRIRSGFYYGSFRADFENNEITHNTELAYGEHLLCKHLVRNFEFTKSDADFVLNLNTPYTNQDDIEFRYSLWWERPFVKFQDCSSKSKELFNGSWKLIKCIQESKNPKSDKPVYPLGEVGKNLTARITFIENKVMFCFMRCDETDSNKILDSGFYYGTGTFDFENNKITLIIELANEEHLRFKQLVRNYRFTPTSDAGVFLVLTTPYTVQDGIESRVIFRWKN
ncbi:hypothetical protein ACFLZV_03470 [Candidatus Margulisiibacteriota bacterium]